MSVAVVANAYVRLEAQSRQRDLLITAAAAENLTAVAAMMLAPRQRKLLATSDARQNVLIASPLIQFSKRHNNRDELRNMTSHTNAQSRLAVFWLRQAENSFNVWL